MLSSTYVARGTTCDVSEAVEEAGSDVTTEEMA